MKKRTISRIAALGLAGLTAVPAISIVASADITFSKEADKTTGMYYATGNATKVVWKIKETTHTYEWFDDAMQSLDNAVVTDLDNDDLNKIDTEATITASNKVTLPLYVEQYYTNSTAAKYDVDLVKLAVEGLNRVYNNAMDEYKAAMKEYTFVKNCLKDEKSGSQAITSDQYRSGLQKGTILYYGKISADATSNSFYIVEKGSDGKNVNIAYDVSNIEDNVPNAPKGAKQYEFTTAATSSSISAGDLIKALGTEKIKVEQNIITAATTNPNYILSAKGGSTTPGGSTGNYGQYDIPSLYRYASNTSYYSYDTDTWYPNSSSFREAVGYYPNSSYSGYWTSKTPAYKYSSSRRWFDPTDGNYYTASGGSGYTVLVSANYETDNTENYVYRSSTTGLYYLTWTAANNATNSYGTVEAIRSIPTYATFFSMTTGQFYSTYAAAYSASGNNSSRVIALNGASASNTGLDYLDPFYYYYMNGGTGLNRPVKDTSSVTIGNRKGWTNVAAYARSAKSGASYNVSMNGETVIPSTVLSAIKGKNVTMNFTLKNGAVFSINGNDVSSAKDLDIDTAYNTKNIPSKLVSKAKKKYDGVSTSQLSIDGGSFGSSAEMTVKFSTKRAGCTARLYRYNADRNSLSLVSKSSVGSNGKCTFDDVTKGGDYVVVLS